MVVYKLRGPSKHSRKRLQAEVTRVWLSPHCPRYLATSALRLPASSCYGNRERPDLEPEQQSAEAQEGGWQCMKQRCSVKPSSNARAANSLRQHRHQHQYSNGGHQRPA